MAVPTMQDVEPLMSEFDFEKVQRVMEMIDWKWSHPEPAHVPSVDELKECVRKLWAQVVESKGGSSRTGGFEVYCYEPSEDEGSGESGIIFWLERVCTPHF